ncbi:MAG: ATP-binding cassette domain-containing protein [Acidimicrobiales bacterium]|nr:ATP-binding cassette domain-containing protein [Acidimicrobiales bacterium]MBO0887345.1 ATP-binding cassette domain-containing protein [Acidimicrobiales bacterium]
MRFSGVSLVRDGRALVSAIDWEVGRDQRWVLLGPNGAGKTTLLGLAAGALHPTTGVVEILGERLGRVDVRQLRARIGLSSGSVLRALRPEHTAAEIVLTGKVGALAPWWHDYGAEDHRRADELLADAGLSTVADHPFGTLSEGERQRTLLARVLMGEPELLLLDEPAAGLDLGARERLVGYLARLAADPATPPLVLVTHHTEEIPPGTTHAALVGAGRLVSAGPIRNALTSSALSACYGMPVELSHRDGRWWSRAAPG